MGDFALLFLVGRLLVCQLGGVLNLEIGVVAGVELEFLQFDVNDRGDRRIKKFAVVGNQKQGAAVVAQPVLKPDDGVKIEVVGWFVQQQHIGTAHQRPCQVKAHAPAAGEFGHGCGLLAG